MLLKVLKAFPYAHDGIHGRDLNPGDIVDIRDGLVAGLKDEGYVGDIEAAEGASASGDATPAAGAAEVQQDAAQSDGDQAKVAAADPIPARKAKRAAKSKAQA